MDKEKERICKILENEGIFITFREVIKKYSSNELREKVRTWFGIYMLKIQEENEHLGFVNKNLQDSLNYWKSRLTSFLFKSVSHFHFSSTSS